MAGEPVQHVIQEGHAGGRLAAGGRGGRRRLGVLKGGDPVALASQGVLVGSLGNRRSGGQAE